MSRHDSIIAKFLQQFDLLTVDVGKMTFELVQAIARKRGFTAKRRGRKPRVNGTAVADQARTLSGSALREAQEARQ